MNGKFQPFQKDGETFLKEVNPHQAPSLYGCRTDEEIENYNNFEQSAISNAKTLLNPVGGKMEYSSEEFRWVWQWYHVIFEKWINAFDDEMTFTTFDDFKENHNIVGIETRQAFEYIIPTHQIHADGHWYDVSNEVAQEVKKVGGAAHRVISNNAASYENGKIAERNRIIGLIEAEISERLPFLQSKVKEIVDENTYRIAALNDLLTKIKQS